MMKVDCLKRFLDQTFKNYVIDYHQKDIGYLVSNKFYYCTVF